MLKYDDAKRIYEEIKIKASESTVIGIDELFKCFLKDAADYAEARTSWSFMDREARIDNDNGRTAKHDAFISILSSVCRNLGIKDAENIMPDRKLKGDFACYVALFLALEQR